MAGQAGGEGAHEGLFTGLKNLVATVLSIGRTRAELLVTEIEEEKYRLIGMWAKAIGAAFLIALGVIMAVFSFALAFWEQRVLVFGFFALLFLLGAALLVLSLRKQAKAPSSLFRSSLAELDADVAHLRGQSRQ
ncbi:phage holin family protein [Azonexus sp.]|uniref:phage holin family protein n=1 Tax=Azonexus sp. TaxID=1872668 RepID=UPI0027B9D95B|nr:phage holin family protein [Azonexus sp.]